MKVPGGTLSSNLNPRDIGDLSASQCGGEFCEAVYSVVVNERGYGNTIGSECLGHFTR
jgi:hypothetical protein